jgi:hypothetical protein
MTASEQVRVIHAYLEAEFGEDRVGYSGDARGERFSVHGTHFALAFDETCLGSIGDEILGFLQAQQVAHCMREAPDNKTLVYSGVDCRTEYIQGSDVLRNGQ